MALELIVTAIKNSETDCSTWSDEAQRELAAEILKTLETAQYLIATKGE